jgi:phosphopantetheinyl transferase (holo-ACP synthase)
VDADGVVASALEVLEVAEVARLAARLAAKRAAARLLGGGVSPSDVEVSRRPGGPPSLRLSPRAEARLHEQGADQILVSLTHERRHAAAAVLLIRSR